MIWGKIMLSAIIAWVWIFFSFFFQLSPSEPFYFSHYFWLVAGAVFIVLAGKKYFYPQSIVRSLRPKRRLRTRQLVRDQIFFGLGMIFLISFFIIFLCLKLLSESIGAQDIAVMSLFLIIGFGLISQGLDLFGLFRR